ncbi:LANO_0G08768g1_1 [Lachancea nothofagi CBS 11611]|uniref:Autophagy-related protein 20 n=1 Tax=Lachancea nothofagi CBS 11611 TaxID=1266666 RepID=A0A1G4KIA7_9SACH|nr:LANO_0G08768g1_1 [Lachancea nothofagi CBS 11611]
MDDIRAMEDSYDDKAGSAADSSVLIDVKRVLGENEVENSEAHENAEPANGTSESEPVGMVHTEILDQDNPFSVQQTSKMPQNGTSLKDPRTLSNPNKAFQDEEDVEPLAVRRESHSSSSGSIEMSPDTSCRESSRQQLGDEVYILEASKASEGQGRTYIAYTIKHGDATVKRRYSDFESLRKILIKLFPMTLIPPIPEKQSITSYGRAMAGSKSSYLLPSEAAGSVDLSLSVINGSVNTNDEKLIRHRIRMLTSFLNRLLKNEEITKTSIISDFLDPNNANWNDVITSSATISSLPKSVLLCNPLDPTNTTRAHAFLPIPSSSTQLLLNKEIIATSVQDETEDGFTKIEQEYRKYEHIMENGFYKYNKRITKNLYAIRQDMKELSEAFAGFSNDQKRGAELAEDLSHLSNTFDESALELESIVGKLYYNINEPLSEAVHMAGAAQELLKYRKLKCIQRSILARTLLYRKAQLKKLQEKETEAKKIDKLVDQQIAQSGHINLKHPEARSYSGKFMNKINKLATIVKESVSYQDADPSAAIENLEKDISQLTESLEVSERDLKTISATIKDFELPKFSKSRNNEVSDILKNYSRYLKCYAEKNLKIWQEAKEQQGG